MKKNEKSTQDLSRGKPRIIDTNPCMSGGCSERRAVIVEALNKSIKIFSSYKEDTFEEVMTNGIRPLVEAVSLDRVIIYSLVERDREKHFGQIYRWDKLKGGLTFTDKELQVISNIPIVDHWISVLSKGECVKIRESCYTQAEKAFLSVYGVKSILIIPIFTQREFWGAVAFQDQTNDRYFDEDCIDLLDSAACIFSNAIIKAMMEQKTIEAFEALNHREKMEAALNKAAVKFLSHSEESFEATMTMGVKEIADTFNLDRFSVWRNFTMPDGLHSSQIYRWDRKSGGTTMPLKGLENINYSQLLPRWENLLASGKTINSPIRLLPEADVLLSYRMVSVFAAPLFFDNIFWGFALLEDLSIERVFEEDSVDMMRSAAFLCANTVIRADMEREIANANEFTRAVLNASPLNFTVFDENAHVIDCNDATLKAFKTTKEYYLEHFIDFSPEYQSDGAKSKDKVVEAIKRTLEGEKQVLEWMHCTSTGELVPYEITLTRTMYNGKYVVMAYQYDLSNTKKMMESIRKQDNLLKIRLEQQELISEISRGFISSGNSEMLVKEAIAKLGHYHKVSLVFIFAIDYQRNDTYLAYYWTANEAPPQSLELKRFEFIKSSFPEILPNVAALPVVSCDDTASSPDTIFQMLSSIDVRAVIAVPLYVEGRLWGTMSVRQCSTPRKWTENEKGFVAMTASTIAGIIMRDIYNTRLTDALHEATAASKAKGDFLSSMSHEIRTPLNAITGMTAIGRNTKDMERKDYALDKIGDASTHLLGVINDVLDMSKIEANMLELSLVEFNLEKMLQRAVTVVNFRAEEKRQKLIVHIDKEIPQTLVTDDQRLAQVITNLLSNAVKFTPEKGSVILSASFKGEENGFCIIQISVKDTGIGISSEQQKRLFSSFQQAENSTTRKYGGTGLGLAISKKIVELMGGTIWIESELEKGSTFTFTIRAMRGTEDKQKHLLDVSLSNVRIMAVDDDHDILTYFNDVVQRFGVLCETAISGKEALELVDQKGGCHIYFIDWKMPVMDGIQLTREIKTRSPENSVVIMISAAEWSAVAKEAKDAGVDKFLSKPLFPSTIAEVINECLGVDKQQEKRSHSADIAGIFAGKHILLVEDVEINREIVQTLLEPTKLEIDCAENGVEAVRMFTEAPDKYDIIFMDVQMPEMDGYDATQCIRELEKTNIIRRVPIVAMTANVFKEDIEKCLVAGMDSHVGKPLDFEEVLNRLHLYLG